MNKLRYLKFSDDIYNFTNLEKITLETNNNICDISSKIGNMINLLEIHILYNYISSLPDEINKLYKLEILNLSYNLFTTFPENLTLSTLKILNLDNNMISKISSNIGSLSSLEILVLSNNKIEELPDEFMKLTDLKDLYLHSNNFSLFPVQVCELNNLEILYLSNNKINEIHKNIQNLTNLQEFYINFNNLSYITNNIILCRKLLVFDFSHIDYNSPQIIRFLNRIDKINTYYLFYNNYGFEQNYYIRPEIFDKIMKITNNDQHKVNKNKIINEIIKDHVLTTNCKLLLLDYSNDTTYHSHLFITFVELLSYVWNNINTKHKIRINNQIKSYQCFSSRFEALL